MEATESTLDCDWCSLPSELLNLIAKKLCQVSDFVRFRAVCTAWRFSIPITDQPPQFPWILEYTGINGYWKEPNLRFYSVTSNKIHTIRVPIVLNKRVMRRALEGHLLLMQHRNCPLSLLNPVNNNAILVPEFPFVCDRFYWIGHQHQPNQKGADNFICSGFHGPNSNCTFGFFNFDQHNWCELKLESNCNYCKHFYLKNMLFTVEILTGVTKAIDITAGSILFIVPPVEGPEPPGFGIINLVEVSGDILRVHQLSQDSIDVHRLESTETGVPCWVNIKNIGDHALFIDLHGCFALRANQLCGIKENCIYLLNDALVGLYESVFRLERIDIKTNVCERLPCPFKEFVCWFAPNLDHLRSR